MDSIKIAQKFEKICFDILHANGFDIKVDVSSSINNVVFTPDAIASFMNKKVILEVKMYRDISVNISLIEKALDRLRQYSYIFNIPNALLIISENLIFNISCHLKRDTIPVSLMLKI